MPDTHMLDRHSVAKAGERIARAIGPDGTETAGLLTRPRKSGSTTAVTDGATARIHTDMLLDGSGVPADAHGLANVAASALSAPTAKADNAEITASIVRDAGELAIVLALRAAVYMGEQDCPYDEEFDGNDLCGAHIIGRVDGEPGGTARVRFFSDFFKLERLTILPKYRGTKLDRAIVAKAVELATRKGYRRVFGTVRDDLVPYWRRRFGFQLLDRPSIQFSGLTFIPMGRTYAEVDSAITFDSDAEIIGRPEGEWDRPGPLDRSSGRPPIKLQRRVMKAAS